MPNIIFVICYPTDYDNDNKGQQTQHDVQEHPRAQLCLIIGMHCGERNIFAIFADVIW